MLSEHMRPSDWGGIKIKRLEGDLYENFFHGIRGQNTESKNIRKYIFFVSTQTSRTESLELFPIPPCLCMYYVYV